MRPQIFVSRTEASSLVLSGLPSAPAASVGPVDMAMDETSGRRPYCRGAPPSEVAAETPRGWSASDERDAASVESTVLEHREDGRCAMRGGHQGPGPFSLESCVIAPAWSWRFTPRLGRRPGWNSSGTWERPGLRKVSLRHIALDRTVVDEAGGLSIHTCRCLQRKRKHQT